MASRLPQPVVEVLRCPVCADGLVAAAGVLRCPAGHSFDLARQGYVNLLGGRASQADRTARGADTAAMLDARAGFLRAGHLDAVTAELTAVAQRVVAPDDVVVDAGAGTGHHLAAVLDAVPTAVGLALDRSRYAARRAAQAHERLGAVVWDTWRPWPVRDGIAGLVLDVFAPRNPAEFRRVLADHGAVVVVTPGADHLCELTAAAGLLTVEAEKEARLDAVMSPHLVLEERSRHTARRALTREDVEHAAAMGPSAHHLDLDGLRRRLDALELPLPTTISFVVSTYRPRGGG
jgi:23S rRNA (guanine745-N1)-methyltransferase